MDEMAGILSCGLCMCVEKMLHSKLDQAKIISLLVRRNSTFRIITYKTPIDVR